MREVGGDQQAPAQHRAPRRAWPHRGDGGRPAAGGWHRTGEARPVEHVLAEVAAGEQGSAKTSAGASSSSPSPSPATA